MPSSTLVAQAASSLGLPSTSTTHNRQAPTSLSPSRWHRVGMWIPFSSAADSTVWSEVAATSLPSMTRVRTSLIAAPPLAHGPLPSTVRRPIAPADGLGADRANAGRAHAVVYVGQVLVPEIAQRGKDRVRSPLAQAAQAGRFYHCRQIFPAGPSGPEWPAP